MFRLSSNHQVFFVGIFHFSNIIIFFLLKPSFWLFAHVSQREWCSLIVNKRLFRPSHHRHFNKRPFFMDATFLFIGTSCVCQLSDAFLKVNWITSTNEHLYFVSDDVCKPVYSDPYFFVVARISFHFVSAYAIFYVEWKIFRILTNKGVFFLFEYIDVTDWVSPGQFSNTCLFFVESIWFLNV